MLAKNSVPQTAAACNGRTLADAFISAFIPPQNNRITVRATRPFGLSIYRVFTIGFKALAYGFVGVTL